MKRKAIVIFDNAGGVTLQLNGEYAHYYQDGENAGEDYVLYQTGADLEGWDGHDEKLLTFEPDYNSIRNGGYKVYDQDDIADMVESTDIETLSDYNRIDFLAVLQRNRRIKKAIYWKHQPGTLNNGFYRLNLDELEKGDYNCIERAHEFKNMLTTCYNVDNRIFAALEKQSADPVKLVPTDEAVQAFDNQDWKELERLFLNME